MQKGVYKAGLSSKNPIWKAVWNNINDNFVSYKPKFSVKSLTGIIRICAGTKLPAINKANIKKFPLNLCFASENPDKELKNRVATTLGMVIIRLFIKYFNKDVSWNTLI